MNNYTITVDGFPAFELSAVTPSQARYRAWRQYLEAGWQATLIEFGKMARVRRSDGCWVSCSGCYETLDGYPCGDYPTHPVHRVPVGAGCTECCGRGIVWEQIPTDEEIRQMLLNDGPQVSPHSGEG